MKVFVGLGNPGEEYQKTRHNVGFMVIEALLRTQNSKFIAQNYNLKFKTEKKFEAEIAKLGDLLLVKPQTFMNRSGEAVQKILSFYKTPPTLRQGFDDELSRIAQGFASPLIKGEEMEGLWVVHDDLDIILGEFKIQLGTGPKVHNGINSIEQALGTKDFWRVRVGIDNRSQMLDGRSWTMTGEEYVLKPFTRDEMVVVDTVIDNVVEEINKRIMIYPSTSSGRELSLMNNNNTNEGLFNQVYGLVRQIPEGKVTTYGEIARVLGVKDVRKVGYALHANKDEKTPCHRVVDKDGRLAPNFAFNGAEEQRRRLEAERVTMIDPMHVDLPRYGWVFASS